MNNDIFWSLNEKYFRVIFKEFYKNIRLEKHFYKYLVIGLYANNQCNFINV